MDIPKIASHYVLSDRNSWDNTTLSYISADDESAENADQKMQDLKMKDLLGMRRAFVIRYREHL